ncbi:MAG: PKD domain-containing protein [Bacteroidales bacterium]|nr:PKD domain-containing protein [Bacteroidales bacterium]
MKKLILLFTLILSITSLKAVEGFDVSFNQPQNNIYELTFNLGDYQLSEVTYDNVTYSKILFDCSIVTTQKGFSELPYINATVQLSADKNVTLKIIEGKYDEYFLDSPLLPSRGVIYRDQDPSTIPYEIDPGSLTDKWFPGNIARNTTPFIIKDLRGTSVYVYPFQYNAMQNVLRVYKQVTVELIENNLAAINPLKNEATTILKEMDGIYKSVFINYEQNKDDLTIGEYGDILIVTTSRDEDAIEPYIQWKKEKGFNVEKIVVATGTNVKTNIQDAYNANNNLLYVQLVGDWEDIKSDLGTTYNAPMDPQLGCVEGTDDHPDICIGRFSANAPNQVTTQVNKVINYEKNPEAGADWYKAATGIASDQGPGDDGELDYEHLDVIWNNKLDSFTYETYSPIYDPTASASMVATAVNNGTSVINYTGHGSSTSWGTTGFNNNDIANLTNGDKLPFIISVACSNGVFHGAGDCFAEAWLKKENGGAVMALMASIGQPWEPPMRGQDYFMDILIGGYNYETHPGQNGISTTEQRTTLGAFVFNGLVLMTTESGQNGDWNTAKTWITFGDPSMQARTDLPADLTLSNETIMTGVPFTTIVTVSGVPVQGAMICLSQDDNFFSGITDVSGEVTIVHTLSPGTAKFVVTAFNTETIYQDATVSPAGGAWITINNFAIDDAAGNNNGLADYGESILLDVAAENVGSDPANGVDATLSSTDDYITITDNTHFYGDIAVGAIVNGDGAFAFTVADNAPDNHLASFQVEFTDGNKNSWTSNISITLHAPVLELDDYVIDDQSGNGNGKLDPGETVELKIDILNNGSSEAYNVSGELICNNAYITIQQTVLQYGNIAGGETGQQAYTVTADINTPNGNSVAFNFEITADLGITGMGAFNIVVGQIPVLIVDLDGNNNSAPAMQQAMEDNGVTPEYTASFPADLSLYSSIFVCLGIYADNHVLTAPEGQNLANYLNNNGNLYMEGGDTWYYDTQTAVHPMFNIDPTDDGSDDLSTIIGLTGTFTEGMSFNYSGDNNWIDHIEAISPAVKIFNNQSPSYGCAVAYDQGDYKTIGASFEFGGLDDGNSTKEELMAEIFEFFGITSGELLAYFIGNPIEICEGETVNFIDYSQGNITNWEWNFPGGDPATSTEQNPSVVYNTAGIYDVSLTVSDGSSSNTYTRTDYIIVNTCAGITEKTANFNINIFPNPSNGYFTLKFNSVKEDIVNIKILNSLNVVVYENKNLRITGDNISTIDISYLSKGVYFLIVENKENNSVSRIIIQN